MNVDGEGALDRRCGFPLLAEPRPMKTITKHSITNRPTTYRCTLVLGLLAFACAMPGHAFAQSDAVSQQSQVSVAASVQVPSAAAIALSEGGAFAVTGIAASAHGVAVTVSALAEGSAFVVELSAEAVARLGIAAGSAIRATVVAGGWLLSAAGEAIAFVANEALKPLIHSRRISG